MAPAESGTARIGGARADGLSDIDVGGHLGRVTRVVAGPPPPRGHAGTSSARLIGRAPLIPNRMWSRTTASSPVVSSTTSTRRTVTWRLAVSLTARERGRRGRPEHAGSVRCR
jgi:hypothetical protein